MPQQFSDNNMDKLFRRQLEHHKVAPSGKVWQQLSVNLHKRNSRLLIFKNSGLLLGVICVLFIGHKILDQEKVNRRLNKEAIKHHVAEISKSALPKNSTINPTDVSLKIHHPVLENKTTLNSIAQVQPVMITNQKNSSLQKIYISQIPASTIGLLNYSIHNNQQQTKNVRNSFMNLKGWYVGVAASTYVSYLLDDAAMNNQAFRYDLHPGFSIGLNAGYNFNSSFGLAFGVNPYATAGQDYFFMPSTTTRTNFQHREIDLRYVQFPVSVKYKVCMLNGKGNAQCLNFNVGLMPSILSHQSYTINNDPSSIQNAFRKADAAFIAGFNYDLYNANKNFISIGMNTSFGSNILNKPNKFIPDEFVSAHNFNAGITAAYNFSLHH